MDSPLAKILSIIFLFLLVIPAKSMRTDWFMHFEGSDQLAVVDMVLDDEGNSYATGFFKDSLLLRTKNSIDTLYESSWGDAFIMKSDSYGNLIWLKQIECQSRATGQTIDINSQGQVISTGSFSASADFDPSEKTFMVSPNGGNASYILILDNDGNFVKMGRLGGSSGMYNPHISIDDEDNIFIAGSFSGGAINQEVDLDPDLQNTHMLKPNVVDSYVLKLDSAANFVWVKQITGYGQSQITSISTNDSKVAITGYFIMEVNFHTLDGIKTFRNNGKNDSFLAVLSKDGDIEEAIHFADNKRIINRDVKLMDSGELYLCGYFEDTLKIHLNDSSIFLKSTGIQTSFLAKWNKNGKFQWIKHFENNRILRVHSMDIAKNGNIYFHGKFRDTADFDPGSNEHLLYSPGKYNLFTTVLNTDGKFVDVHQLDINSNYVSTILTQPNGSMYVAGNFNAEAKLKTYSGDTTLFSSTNEDGLILKMSKPTIRKLSLGNDTTLCEGDSLLLNFDFWEGDRFRWSTSDTSKSIFVKKSGNYFLNIWNCGRFFSDSIQVTYIPRPTVDLGADTIACENTGLNLSAMVSAADSYLWNTNDTSQSINSYEAGVHWLKVGNQSVCYAIDSINVLIWEQPHKFAEHDTVLCAKSEFIVDAGNPGSTYKWSTGDSSRKLLVLNNGTYTLTVSNDYCSTEDSISISFLSEDECLPGIVVPNVFSPNNDGINDVFMLQSRNVEGIELQIFNRWGQLIYESRNVLDEWDARVQGRKIPEGSYFYSLVYDYYNWDTALTEQKKLKGTIQILR